MPLMSLQVSENKSKELCAEEHGFQAAGTRLKKGYDGNLRKFYKDKCENMHL